MEKWSSYDQDAFVFIAHTHWGEVKGDLHQALIAFDQSLYGLRNAKKVFAKWAEDGSCPYSRFKNGVERKGHQPERAVYFYEDQQQYDPDCTPPTPCELLRALLRAETRLASPRFHRF